MSHPGRSTAIIFVICVVAVGGAAFYVGQPGATRTVNQENIVAYNPNPSLIATGTLADWKTQFMYATTSQYVSKTAPKAPTGPSTVTEALGMNFLSRFADLKQANLVGNTDIVNQTVDNMLTTSLDPLKPKVYSANDLRVTASSDAGTLASFSKALSTLIGSYAVTTGEFAIIQAFVSSNDPSVLVGLQPIIAEQKRIMAGILSIPVPQILLKDDVDLANGFSTLEAASESLRIADTDAVRALIGTSLHSDGAQAIANALSSMDKILELNGMVFDLRWEILNPLLN
jgi:hypothetical protein